jgi:hypothetical protein
MARLLIVLLSVPTLTARLLVVRKIFLRRMEGRARSVCRPNGPVCVEGL